MKIINLEQLYEDMLNIRSPIMLRHEIYDIEKIAKYKIIDLKSTGDYDCNNQVGDTFKLKNFYNISQTCMLHNQVCVYVYFEPTFKIIKTSPSNVPDLTHFENDVLVEIEYLRDIGDNKA